MLIPLVEQIRVPRIGPGRARTRPNELLGDKDYSSRAIRKYLRQRAITATIAEPADQKRHRTNRGTSGGRPPKFDAQSYKGRNIVERGFLPSEAMAGITTRYDKLATTFRAAALLHGVIAWTKHLSHTPYIQGWDAQMYGFHVYLINSSIIRFGATLGTLFSNSLAAYAFARLDSKFRTPSFALMLGTLVLPFHVVMFPQFILFRELGWLDTFLPLIVPKFLATEAFFIFLMVQFVRSLPNELYGAAQIDGAGHFRQFFHTTLLLMVPALATTTIFTFIWIWAGFFGLLLYLRTPENYVVPQALNMFIDGTSTPNSGIK